MESLPIANFEQRQQSPDFNAPTAEHLQLQPPDSMPNTIDHLHLPAPEKKPKVPRDEEPPIVYRQKRPTGVRKQAQGESVMRGMPRERRRRAPETANQPFELPPSLVSDYPMLGCVQQQQQLAGSYRNFGGTGSAVGGRADQRNYDLVPQAQAPYQPHIDELWLANTRATPQQQQGTYRTFEAQKPVNTVDTDRIFEEEHYILANKSQSVRDQFGARLPSPDELVTPSSKTELPSQRQPDHYHNIPDPRSLHYESPFSLIPQMECSFALPDDTDTTLDNFDFDAFLREEELNHDDGFGSDASGRGNGREGR